MGKYTKKAIKFFENIRETNGITEKKCTGCGEWKPLDDKHYYYKNKKKPEKGFQSECRICTVKRSSKYQYNHAEERSAYNRQLYEDNPEYFKEKQKRNYHKKPEHYLALQEKWRKENPEKVNLFSQFRALHKNHRLSKTEWLACKIFFNNECAYCGLHVDNHYNKYKGKLRKEDLHKEHVYHYGDNSLSNCVPSCKKCNSSKHTYLLDEWYNENNKNYTLERFNKIMQWVCEEYKIHAEEKKPKRKYERKIKSL